MRSFAIYLYGPDAGPLPSRFEQVAGRLSATDRLFFEWDGSFVWRGTAAGEAWQLDGAIYDRDERIQYVDLKGRCPWPAWHQLLESFDVTPAVALSVLVLPDRRALDREQFEKEIWGKSSAPEALA